LYAFKKDLVNLTWKSKYIRADVQVAIKSLNKPQTSDTLKLLSKFMESNLIQAGSLIGKRLWTKMTLQLSKAMMEKWETGVSYKLQPKN